MAERELQVLVTAKDEASAKMKTIGENIHSGLNKAAVAAGIAGAALGLFVGKGLKDLANLGEQLDNTSKTTGASAGALSSLKVAAEAMGSSLDAVSGGMVKMNNNIDAAHNGNKAMADSLGRIGMSAKDFAGLSTEQSFIKIGNAIAGMNDPMARNAVAMDLLGKSGGDLIPLFAGGKSSLEGFAGAAKDAGLYMDEVSMKKALALDDAMDKLNGAFGGVKDQIMLALAPAITNLLLQIQPVVEKVTEWIEKHPQLTAGIIAVMAAVLGLLVFLPMLLTGIGAIATVFTFIAANPIVLVIAAIALLVAAIAFLITNWDLVSAKVIEVWQNIHDAIWEKIDAVKTYFTDLIENGIAVLIGWWDSLVDGVTAVWDKIVSTVKAKVDAIKNFISDCVGAIQGALDKLAEFSGFNAYTNAVKAAGKATGVALGLRKNATGGNIYAGQSSVVGEQGAEVVSFDRGGRIIPNNRLGGGSTNVTIILKDNTLLSDAQDVAVKIGDLIIDRLRLQTRLA